MRRDKVDWQLKVRVWIQRGGEKLLGPGRAELLGLIERHGSISAAARRMNMSYRRAWTLVRAINDIAGEQLVELATGGAGGGGATLTARGREALAYYRRIVDQATRAAAKAAARPADA